MAERIMSVEAIYRCNPCTPYTKGYLTEEVFFGNDTMELFHFLSMSNIPPKDIVFAVCTGGAITEEETKALGDYLLTLLRDSVGDDDGHKAALRASERTNFPNEWYRTVSIYFFSRDIVPKLYSRFVEFVRGLK